MNRPTKMTARPAPTLNRVTQTMKAARCTAKQADQRGQVATGAL